MKNNCFLCIGIFVGDDQLSLPQLNENQLLIQPNRILAEYFLYFDGEVSNGAIKYAKIFDYLATECLINVVGPVVVTRIFLFYVLELVRYILDVINVEDVGRYDWGSVIFARMYSGLDVAYRIKIKIEMITVIKKI